VLRTASTRLQQPAQQRPPIPPPRTHASLRSSTHGPPCPRRSVSALPRWCPCQAAARRQVGDEPVKAGVITTRVISCGIRRPNGRIDKEPSARSGASRRERVIPSDCNETGPTRIPESKSGSSRVGRRHRGWSRREQLARMTGVLAASNRARPLLPHMSVLFSLLVGPRVDCPPLGHLHIMTRVRLGGLLRSYRRAACSRSGQHDRWRSSSRCHGAGPRRADITEPMRSLGSQTTHRDYDELAFGWDLAHHGVPTDGTATTSAPSSCGRPATEDTA